MSTPIRSANKAYYASKAPLLFRGTKEGRKNPPTAPSYKQKANDITASSSKYYAEMPEPGATVPQQQKKSVKRNDGPVKSLDAHPKILQDVVRAFQQGASSVSIRGEAAAISSARAAVDMAVGRKTLTREQADQVMFAAVKAVVKTEAEIKKETKEAKKAATARTVVKTEAEIKKETKEAKKAATAKKAAATRAANKAKKEAEAKVEPKVEPKSVMSEADVILNPVTEEKGDSITDADVAEAFGVDTTDESFDDDDDSDD